MTKMLTHTHVPAVSFVQYTQLFLCVCVRVCVCVYLTLPGDELHFPTQSLTPDIVVKLSFLS